MVMKKRFTPKSKICTVFAISPVVLLHLECLPSLDCNEIRWHVTHAAQAAPKTFEKLQQ